MLLTQFLTFDHLFVKCFAMDMNLKKKIDLTSLLLIMVFMSSKLVKIKPETLIGSTSKGNDAGTDAASEHVMELPSGSVTFKVCKSC